MLKFRKQQSGGTLIESTFPRPIIFSFDYELISIHFIHFFSLIYKYQLVTLRYVPLLNSSFHLCCCLCWGILVCDFGYLLSFSYITFLSHPYSPFLFYACRYFGSLRGGLSYHEGWEIEYKMENN